MFATPEVCAAGGVDKEPIRQVDGDYGGVADAPLAECGQEGVFLIGGIGGDEELGIDGFGISQGHTAVKAGIFGFTGGGVNELLTAQLGGKYEGEIAGIGMLAEVPVGEEVAEPYGDVAFGHG